MHFNDLSKVGIELERFEAVDQVAQAEQTAVVTDMQEHADDNEEQANRISAIREHVGEFVHKYSLGRRIAIGAATGAFALGGTGVALAAKSGTKMSSAEVNQILNCKNQVTIKGSDVSNKGKGINAYSVTNDDKVTYGYKIMKKNLKFYKAMGILDNSFKPVKLTVKKMNKTNGEYRNTIAVGDRGDVRQVTFCAK